MFDVNNDTILRRIVCLTEEPVETLYLLEKEELIVGVSVFVKRPEAARALPKVSFFTSSHYKKIIGKKPDLIIGHSDIQKDIARDLIEMGQNVFIANHRSLVGILQYIQLLSNLVGANEKGKELVGRLHTKIVQTRELTKNLQKKPKVYFEEWDGPLISGIQWVSELIELCGGVDITAHRAKGVLAKERIGSHEEIIAADPDIIFGCWCGKKVNTISIKERANYEQVAAVKSDRVYELAPEIFLQPGPAPILSGIDILMDYFEQFRSEV